MDTEDIERIIARASPELRAAGVSALYLFGSRARGDDAAGADIDLAFDLSAAVDATFSLLDQSRVQHHLEDMLGCSVDFVERSSIHPDLRSGIERDLRRLF